MDLRMDIKKKCLKEIGLHARISLTILDDHSMRKSIPTLTMIEIFK